MTSKVINRYAWLLNLLQQYRRLTFEEISILWEGSGLAEGKPLALRTFHVHRKAIAELFDVEIKCDTSTYQYYLSSTDVLRNDRIKKWLINSTTASNIVQVGANMKDRILFEEIPRGTEYLQTVIDAMRHNKVVRIDYSPYGEGRHRIEFQLHPYAMKVYHQRWYLLGYLVEQSGIRNIALDRITELEVLDKTFVYPENFDAKKYYQNTIGIFVNDELTPQIVRIKAFGTTIEYLRSLPLHQSQSEAKTKYGEYSEFEYKLSLTPELSSQLLALGENIEVLEPAELREEIISRLKAALNRYNKC